MRSRRLRTRLMASFVAVALVGVGTLAVLVAAILPGRLTQLVIEREDEAARRAAEALGQAYRGPDGWTGEDLSQAAAIAAGVGGVEVRAGHVGRTDGGGTSADGGADGESGPDGDTGPIGGTGPDTGTAPGHGPGGDGGAGEGGTDGTTGGDGEGSPGTTGGSTDPQEDGTGGHGEGPGGPTQSPGPDHATSDTTSSVGLTEGVVAADGASTDPRTVHVPIVVDGEVVGTLTVRYPSEGLPLPEQEFARSLRWSIVVASALAVLVAVAVAVVVARRIDRPISRLTRAARRLGAGDLTARVQDQAAPREVGELAASFDQMAESLAREDEVRRALVADVAHELRTPVTILQASLEELVDGTVEPGTQELSSLHDEVLRLGRILQDLETLSAAQSARLEMQVQPVDLAEVATEALERLHGSFEAVDITPQIDLEPARVLGDPARLDQVVTNLLTNALKFTPPGGDIHVAVAAADGDARLEVDDSGPGIPADELDHVFERFWRGRAGRSASGSGVGLAVAAELIHAHRGRIAVSSPPGSGAHFLVTLPRA